MTRRARTASRNRSKTAAVLALAAVLLALATPGVRAGSDGPVRILGKLPGQAPNAQLFAGGARIIQVDGARRRLYYVERPVGGSMRMIEYDIAPAIPRPLRKTSLQNFPSSVSSYQTAFDSRRRSLSFIDIYQAASGTIIRRFDLLTFKSAGAWDLATKVPGFVAVGIIYAPQDDRFYLVGDLSLNGSLVRGVYDAFGVIPQGPPTVVVALDAASGDVAWVRQLTQCPQVMSNFGQGGFLARSSLRDALYIFCYSGGASANLTVAYPAATGLVRLGMSSKGTQNDALNYPVEFFPVSGSYRGDAGLSGQVALDPLSDRLFVQSLSKTTPGAWVFDGIISAWIGLIGAPDFSGVFQAINMRSGHYYLSSDEALRNPSAKRYLLVSNARMTPPPQGDVFDIEIAGDITPDPLTKRLFAPLKDKSGVYFYVLEDGTPDPEVPQPVDYDDLTTDVAEGAGTQAAYSASLSGFGARAFVVGGVGGARAMVNTDNLSELYSNALDAYRDSVGRSVPAVTPGDRGLFLGRVASVDLQNSGSSASAQGVAPDELTADDVTNSNNLVGSEAPPLADRIVWPWPAAACLDGTGEKRSETQPGPNGEGKVECDLAKNSTTASSYVQTGTFGPLIVGYASFSSSVTRDAANGAVGSGTAFARGIELFLDGVGGLHIGRVTATAKTIAHGRPGTAHVTYERSIQDVRITDAAGKESFSCAASCDMDSVAQAVNGNFGLKVRMDVPNPDIVATTRGAFARVQKTYRDYIGGQAQNNDSLFDLPALQLTINNDSASKSRLLVQVAALHASSIYGISLQPGEFGDDGSVLPPVVSSEPLPLPPTTLTNTVYVPQVVRVPVGGVLSGAFLLARSPKDLAIVMLIFLLVAGSIVTAYRRHSLISHLEDETV